MHLFGRCRNARLKIKKHKHFCRPFMKLSISCFFCWFQSRLFELFFSGLTFTEGLNLIFGDGLLKRNCQISQTTGDVFVSHSDGFADLDAQKRKDIVFSCIQAPSLDWCTKELSEKRYDKPKEYSSLGQLLKHSSRARASKQRLWLNSFIPPAGLFFLFLPSEICP